MKFTAFRIVLVALVVLATGVTAALFHLENARLRRHLAALKMGNAQLIRDRDENRRLREIVLRAESDQATAKDTLDGELVRLRSEVAAAEDRAHRANAAFIAQRRRDDDALANNHDPHRGLTRLENFTDQGSDSPDAAFQTFIWAAMQGKDDRLTALIRIDSSAHEKAAALMDSLSESNRAKFPTVERVAALFLASAVTNQPAAEIVGITNSDPDHALVEVRGLTDKPQKIPFIRSADGWRIVVTSGMVKKLGQWVGSPSGG